MRGEDGRTEARRSAARTIPLSLLTTTSAGQAIVDKGAVLDVREKAFAVDTSKPFKLNADTSGVCASLFLSALYFPPPFFCARGRSSRAGDAA